MGKVRRKKEKVRIRKWGVIPACVCKRLAVGIFARFKSLKLEIVNGVE
jgi:hypothetical protein